MKTFFGWMTTAPNPRRPATGVDAGQRGWKLHAVTLQETTDPKELGRYTKLSALCGLRPRHGWGLDMFIEAECTACQRIMTRMELAGTEFIDLPERRAAEYQARRELEVQQQEYEEDQAALRQGETQ